MFRVSVRGAVLRVRWQGLRLVQGGVRSRFEKGV